MELAYGVAGPLTTAITLYGGIRQAVGAGQDFTIHGRTGVAGAVNGVTVGVVAGDALGGSALAIHGSVHIVTGWSTGGAVDQHGGDIFLYARDSNPAGGGGGTAGGNVRVFYGRSGTEGWFDVNCGPIGGATQRMLIDGTVLQLNDAAGSQMIEIHTNEIGLYGTAPCTQQTVAAGLSRGGATVAVLTDLLTKLALTGIIVDGSIA
jgi:hypothetical protein